METSKGEAERQPGSGKKGMTACKLKTVRGKMGKSHPWHTKMKTELQGFLDGKKRTVTPHKKGAHTGEGGGGGSTPRPRMVGAKKAVAGAPFLQ